MDPAGLEALGDRVDPDALNVIFARRRDGEPRTDGWVRFAYAGCSVTVHSGGEIAVAPIDRGDERA